MSSKEVRGGGSACEWIYDNPEPQGLGNAVCPRVDFVVDTWRLYLTQC